MMHLLPTRDFDDFDRCFKDMSAMPSTVVLFTACMNRQAELMFKIVAVSCEAERPR